MTLYVEFIVILMIFGKSNASQHFLWSCLRWLYHYQRLLSQCQRWFYQYQNSRASLSQHNLRAPIKASPCAPTASAAPFSFEPPLYSTICMMKRSKGSSVALGFHSFLFIFRGVERADRPSRHPSPNAHLFEFNFLPK